VSVCVLGSWRLSRGISTSLIASDKQSGKPIAIREGNQNKRRVPSNCSRDYAIPPFGVTYHTWFRIATCSRMLRSCRRGWVSSICQLMPQIIAQTGILWDPKHFTLNLNRFAVDVRNCEYERLFVSQEVWNRTAQTPCILSSAASSYMPSLASNRVR